MARFTSLRHGPDNLNAEQGWALGWCPTLPAVHPPSGPGHLELSLLSPHVCRFASGMFRLLHSDCDVVAYVFLLCNGLEVYARFLQQSSFFDYGYHHTCFGCGYPSLTYSFCYSYSSCVVEASYVVFALITIFLPVCPPQLRSIYNLGLGGKIIEGEFLTPKRLEP